MLQKQKIKDVFYLYFDLKGSTMKEILNFKRKRNVLVVTVANETSNPHSLK